MTFFKAQSVRFNKEIKKKNLWQGWRNGSEVKSSDCSSRNPEFKFQQPHGGSHHL
jgi:hypothetical protein